MATIATLNTVFSASHEKFTQATKVMQRDLSTFERAVSNVQKKMLTLENAFKIGAGFSMAEGLATKLHQGIARSVEAMAEGVKHGQSFADSFEDAAKAAFGMETGLAQAMERAKQYHEVLGKIREGQHAAGTAPGKESTLATLQEAVKRATAAAAPGLAAIDKARAHSMRGDNIYTGSQSLRLFQLDEIKKKWANQLSLLEMSEQALSAYLKAQERAKAQADAVAHGWSQIKATVMGGAATGPNGTVFKSGMLPNAAANFQNSAAGAFGPLGDLAGVIGKTIERAAAAGAGGMRSKEEQEKAKDRASMIERIQRDMVTPLDRFKEQAKLMEDLFAKGDITQQQFDMAKSKELAALNATLPDSNRRATGAEYGSQAAFRAIANTDGNRTEKETLQIAERQLRALEAIRDRGPGINVVSI